MKLIGADYICKMHYLIKNTVFYSQFYQILPNSTQYWEYAAIIMIYRSLKCKSHVKYTHSATYIIRIFASNLP